MKKKIYTLSVLLAAVVPHIRTGGLIYGSGVFRR